MKKSLLVKLIAAIAFLMLSQSAIFAAEAGVDLTQAKVTVVNDADEEVELFFYPASGSPKSLTVEANSNKDVDFDHLKLENDNDGASIQPSISKIGGSHITYDQGLVAPLKILTGQRPSNSNINIKFVASSELKYNVTFALATSNLSPMESLKTSSTDLTPTSPQIVKNFILTIKKIERVKDMADVTKK